MSAKARNRRIFGTIAFGTVALGIAIGWWGWTTRRSFEGVLTEMSWRPLMSRGYEPPGDFPPPPALLEDGPGHILTTPAELWVSYNLTDLRDQPMLRPKKAGAIRPLGDPASFRPDAEPLVLVHGINGQPADLQAVVQRFRNDPRFQLYIYAYDDMGQRTSINGRQLAEEIHARFSATPRLTIIAHSMGGLVTLSALCVLADDPQAPPMRVLTIDTPWHGFSGPADSGMGSVAMWFARPFLPDGLEDMRSESRMFVGGGSRDPLDTQGVYGVDLPADLELHMVFAADGDAILNYREGKLALLSKTLAGHYADRTPVTGEPELVNAWRALQRSSDFPAFEAAAQTDPTPDAIERQLEHYCPIFPGDHTGVLTEQEEGLPEAAARWVYTGAFFAQPPS